MATEVTQATELAQVTQTLKWLDEAHRKDRATITALQERIQGQEQRLAQQAAQAQELQVALAGVQGVLSKVTGFEPVVSNFKGELIAQMEQRDETRRKEQAEAERLRRIEYQALTEGLNRLEKTTRVLPRYDEELNARRVEDQRLFEAIQRLEAVVADLSKRSDDRVQGVVYLEEQRRADNRRIADLEHDTTALHKMIEALAVKFPLLEEAVQKQRSRIEEAIQEAKKYDKPIEELRVSDFQREQKMKQYLDQGEQVAQELERVRAQAQGFLEQQQLAKRALDKLAPFQARMEKRQNEVAEMQRLSEDRVKRQWEEWQGEQDKQQKKREVLVEERWRQQGQVNAEHQKRLDTLQTVTDMHHAQLDTFWEARRSDAIRMLENTQAGYEAAIAQINAQLSILRGEQ
jgi:chromosome segregation ATPase